MENAKKLNTAMQALHAHGAAPETLAEIVPGALVVSGCLTVDPKEIRVLGYTPMDLEDATAALLAHGADLKALATVIPGAEVVEGCLVVDPKEVWVDEGMGDAEPYPGIAREEAAIDYVGEGDWGPHPKTGWIRVWSHLRGLDENGKAERVARQRHIVPLEPAEPDCLEEMSHDWKAPHELLGGNESNPGCRAHGGGVIYTEVCAHCGAYRDTDTWAQNPHTGEQGLRQTTYREADDASWGWAAKQTARTE
jgi:hypothetical protein